MTAIEHRKLTKLAEWIEEASSGDYHPYGYSDDARVVDDCVVVASLDGGKEHCQAVLHVYEKDYALEWHDRILDYRRRHRSCDLAEAVNECQP